MPVNVLQAELIKAYFVEKGYFAGGSGTVTTMSVVSANGFAGTVADPTTTPAVTLSTTVTGLLKGNGTAISAAVADTDYQSVLVSGTNIKTINGLSLLGSGDLSLSGTGDVVGPASAVDNRVVFFDGTSGKLIKDSGLTLSGSNTGDQTITLTGDVTGSGTGSFAATIGAGTVTLAKMANLAANSIIGNNTGAPATPVALTVAQVKTLLAYTASDVGLGNVTNDQQTKSAIVPNTAPSAGQILVGNAGGTAYAPITMGTDATLTSAGALTIANNAVTYAKMQDVSATSRILGRRTAGAGDPEECTLTQVLDFVGSAANGDLLIRSGGSWTRLAIGSASNVLTVSGGLPAWAAPAASADVLADVTLGVAGTSLSSGTITAKGILEVDIYIEGYAGGDTASLQFNATGGTGYRYRWLRVPAGSTTFSAGLIAASTDRIKVASANTTLSRRVKAIISNDLSVTEKLVKFLTVTATGSAGTQADDETGNGAWISGASTQITRIDLISSSNMTAGTRMVIRGW